MSQLDNMIIQYVTFSIRGLNHAAVLLDVPGEWMRGERYKHTVYTYIGIDIRRYDCILLMH